VSINGVNDVLNNQLVDGMDNNERTIGTVAIKPSIDAIAEVRVQTNMYTAETGRTLGGVINIITKSGSNAFHGSGFEFAATRNSTPSFLCAGQAGESARTSLAAALADRCAGIGRSSSSTTRVPDQAGCADRCDRAHGQDAGRRFLGAVHQIYDAQNGRTAFAGNVIPAARFDPIAVKYMQLYPAPNGPGWQQLLVYEQRTQDNDATDVRVDHKFDDRTLFSRAIRTTRPTR
jgi:hypothetical protein